MTYWLKCAHSHVSRLQSNSSFSKPASYPFILGFSSTTCNLPPESKILSPSQKSWALLRQLTWWHFGSRLHRLLRFSFEQKLISGKDWIKSFFFNPVCFPRKYFWPWSVLEWRMHFRLFCWNVYATHLSCISHFHFEWIFHQSSFYNDCTINILYGSINP